MKTFRGEIASSPALSDAFARSWTVEIHLSPGGIVWERILGEDPHAVIEAALARSYIVPDQVNGITAYPFPAPAAA